MARPNSYRDVSYLLAVAVAVVVVATLYLARVVLVPFALAMLFSFLLTPVVVWLERIRFPRPLAVLFVVAFSVAAMSLVGWAVTDQLVVLWNWTGDLKQAGSRISGRAHDEVSKTFAQAIQQIGILTGIVPQLVERPVQIGLANVLARNRSALHQLHLHSWDQAMLSRTEQFPNSVELKMVIARRLS